MPLSLASSALKEAGFDLIKTVDAGRKYKFPWVQLFVNSSMYDAAYLDRLASKLTGSNTGVVIHLPNIDKLTEEDIQAAERLADLLPANEVRTLIHYDDSLSADSVPQINGRKVGIENSKTGTFDPVHIAEACVLAKEIGSPFVFDIGRIMYADENHDPEEILTFVIEIISSLDPEKDLVHVAGKTDWTKRFRDCSCALGSRDDIYIPLIPYLIEFSERGGIIVLENENMEEALNSVTAFRPSPY